MYRLINSKRHVKCISFLFSFLARNKRNFNFETSNRPYFIRRVMLNLTRTHEKVDKLEGKWKGIVMNVICLARQEKLSRIP